MGVQIPAGQVRLAELLAALSLGIDLGLLRVPSVAQARERLTPRAGCEGKAHTCHRETSPR